MLNVDVSRCARPEDISRDDRLFVGVILAAIGVPELNDENDLTEAITRAKLLFAADVKGTYEHEQVLFRCAGVRINGTRMSDGAFAAKAYLSTYREIAQVHGGSKPGLEHYPQRYAAEFGAHARRQIQENDT